MADPGGYLSLKSRLDDLCDRILTILEKRPGIDLTELASQLHAPFSLTCISVGWLVRFRVIELSETAGTRVAVTLEQLWKLRAPARPRCALSDR